MSKILSKLFGNAGGAVVDKLAGVADKFIRTKDEKAEFEKKNDANIYRSRKRNAKECY